MIIANMPYSIGQTIYVVKEYNEYRQSGTDRVFSDGERKITIAELILEGFIIDKDGIYLAEETHDGWSILVDESELDFGDIEKALAHVASMGCIEI